MKTLDVLVWTLLAIGGLNWGLVGVFNFDLVAAIFGEMSVLSRTIYTLVGLSAVYDILAIKAIWKRWGMHFGPPAHA
ncbi:MAG: DUF378 domain-containing protein [Planctomycetota bacterium]|jgi:uncharacterized membrane protein YuzA (DUF378 family)